MLLSIWNVIENITSSVVSLLWFITKELWWLGIIIFILIVLRKNFRKVQVSTSLIDQPVFGQTKYAQQLRAALKERGIDSIAEYSDGYKTVDLAIPSAKLYIEVDGMQHFKDVKQVISDMKRDDYSHQDGYHTIRVSNFAIRKDVNAIAEEIKNQVEERKGKININS